MARNYTEMNKTVEGREKLFAELLLTMNDEPFLSLWDEVFARIDKAWYLTKHDSLHCLDIKIAKLTFMIVIYWQGNYWQGVLSGYGNIDRKDNVLSQFLYEPIPMSKYKVNQINNAKYSAQMNAYKMLKEIILNPDEI